MKNGIIVLLKMKLSILKQVKTWIQEDGICKLMSEMSLDHLNNAIKYVDKKIKEVEYCPISKENMKKMKNKRQELKRMYEKKKKL